MRAAIFSEHRLKSRLETILHPLIARRAMAEIEVQNGPYCLLVIPLFAESESYSWVDRVLVVDVPEAVQVQRVMARDGISRVEAKATLAAQASRARRLALADDVLDNSGSLEDLHRQVEDLHRKYLALA